VLRSNVTNILSIIFVQKFKESEAEVKSQTIILLGYKEGELSQRGRAMICVVEMFAVS